MNNEGLTEEKRNVREPEKRLEAINTGQRANLEGTWPIWSTKGRTSKARDGCRNFQQKWETQISTRERTNQRTCVYCTNKSKNGEVKLEFNTGLGVVWLRFRRAGPLADDGFGLLISLNHRFQTFLTMGTVNTGSQREL